MKCACSQQCWSHVRLPSNFPRSARGGNHCFVNKWLKNSAIFQTDTGFISETVAVNSCQCGSSNTGRFIPL